MGSDGRRRYYVLNGSSVLQTSVTRMFSNTEEGRAWVEAEVKLRAVAELA